jgi:hypothetical protein
MVSSSPSDNSEIGYSRPHDKWVCGHNGGGKGCLLGPDAQGRCRAAGECTPWLEGGRWHCRRSARKGGPCEQGPNPDGTCCNRIQICTPRRTLRSKRRRIIAWAAGLVVGLVALILAGGEANELLMPGPLASSHANLENCQSCHAGGSTRKLGWLHNLSEQVDPAKSSELCVACHDLGADRYAAHTHPVAHLKELTAAASQAAPAQSATAARIWNASLFQTPEPMAPGGGNTLYCATCHEDHQGGRADLTSMSNDRCQTCHVSRFGDFASSHPEYSDYPFNRRLRIVFDHRSHLDKHFPETATKNSPAGVPPDCETCHEAGPGEKYMETTSFFAMCSGCHSQDIRGTTRASGPKGVRFLAVPGLDLETLDERGVDIGAWPEDSEADLTPFMRWLLAKNLGGRDIVKEVSALDLLDLREASDGDLEAVATMAWSVKELFYRIRNSGLKAVLLLPDNYDGVPVDHLQLGAMTAVMARDVVGAGTDEWFPNLEHDLKQRKAGKPTMQAAVLSEIPPADAISTPPQQDSSVDLENGAQDELPDDGGLLDDDDLSLDGDLAGDDGLMEDEVPDDSGLLGEDDDAVGGGLLDEVNLSETSEASGEAALLGDEAETDDGGLLSTDTQAVRDDLPDDGGLLGEEAFDDSAGLLGGGQDADDPLVSPLEARVSDDGLSATEDEPGSVLPPEKDPETWAEFGGWYRMDNSIVYRPGGHADRFVRAWLTYSGNAFGSDEEPLLSPVFSHLSDKGAVGRCTKCHSIDNEGQRKHIKWRGFSTKRVKSRFTTFSHQPHVRISGDEGCLFCHRLETGKSDFLATYNGGDESIFAPVFAPLNKSDCSGCHTESSAGEDCTLCHQYHATEFGRPLVKTELPTGR